MSSCLPFMLLSSSIPLTMQSNVLDPGFQDLAADQRPGSRLSGPRPATIAIQPSRTPSPSDELQRGHMRAPISQSRDVPRSVPVHRRQRPRNCRNMRAAPPIPELPAIHEKWIGTENSGSKGHVRRISEPVKKSTPIFEIDQLPLSSRRSSDLPSARSSTTLPSIRLSLGSRFSTASTLAPRVPSPTLLPETNGSLDPPSPSLRTLEEDIVLQLPEPRRAVAAPYILGEDVAEGSSSPPILSSNSSIPASPSLSALDGDTSEVIGSCPRRQASTKSVSFSTDVPQIILSPDNILEDKTEPLRRQSSWSGLFLISAPPVAAKPPLTRQPSIQTVRGQTAGKSCLKRTSVLKDDSTMEEAPERVLSKPVVRRKSLPRSRSARSVRTTSPAPQLLMPSLPESPSPDALSFVAHGSSSERTDEITSDENQRTDLVGNRDSVQTMIVITHPRKPKPTLSLEQKAVRHWSMTNNGWVRRSEIYANGSRPVPAARDAPPVPSIPIRIDALSV